MNSTTTAGRRAARMLLPGLIMLAAAALLTGCEEAGAGGGNDDAETQTLDTTSMVLHLAFDGNLDDETGTATNVDPRTNTGSASAGYAADRNGVADEAVSLTSNYLKVDGISLSGVDKLTVMAWVYDGMTSNLDRWVAAYVSGFNTASEANVGAFRISTKGASQPGALEARLNDGAVSLESAGTVTRNSWTHLAMVLDIAAGELRIYEDGAQTGTESVPTGLSLSDGTLVIGGRPVYDSSDSFANGAAPQFTGRIDDLAIFTRALSDEEIELAKDQLTTN